MTQTHADSRWDLHRGKRRRRHTGEALGRSAPLAVVVAVAALAALPGEPRALAAVAAVGRTIPQWAWMWLLAWSVWFACKWATWWPLRHAPRRWTVHLAYVLCHPGMDAQPVLVHRRTAALAPAGDWLRAFAALHLGAAVVWGITPRLVSYQPMLAAWCVMIGVVLMLHFGIFALLTCYWREHGFDVRPMMWRPVRSRSLAEFWGARWNRDFHRLAGQFIFNPMRPLLGARLALLATFLASGLVHDLVISLPARGGLGGPSVYFVIQGLGVLAERRLRRTAPLLLRRAWMVCILAAPLPLLFHAPFIERIVLPFAAAIGAVQ